MPMADAETSVFTVFESRDSLTRRAVPSMRLRRMRLFCASVQRFPTLSPARFTTASHPSRIPRMGSSVPSKCASSISGGNSPAWRSGARTSARTWCPAVRSLSTSARPMNPVDPVTATRMPHLPGREGRAPRRVPRGPTFESGRSARAAARGLSHGRYRALMPAGTPNRAPHPSRRTVLKRGLLGGAALLLGGGAFLELRSTRRVPPPPEGLLVFDELEYSTLDAVSRRIVDPLPGAPTADEVRVAFNADRVMALADPGTQRDMKRLMRLLENALVGFFLSGRTLPFTRLSPQQHAALLRSWRDSSLALRRTGFEAIRTLCLAGYFGSPKSWPAASYPGPPKDAYDPDAPVWTGPGEEEGSGGAGG